MMEENLEEGEGEEDKGRGSEEEGGGEFRVRVRYIFRPLWLHTLMGLCKLHNMHTWHHSLPP